MAAGNAHLSHCKDVDSLICEHLLTGYPDDDRTILGTATICKSMLHNPVMVRERPAAKARLQLRQRVLRDTQFPKEYEKAFREAGYPLKDFPALAMPAGGPDYIKIRPEQMTHPVMIFKDNRGRDGFALLLQRKDNPAIRTVITLHKRDPHPKSRYPNNISDSDAKAAYRTHHNLSKHGADFSPLLGCGNYEYCHEYAFHEDLPASFITNLLKGEDPFFELSGPMPAKKQVPQSWIVPTICAITSVAVAAASAALLMWSN